MWIWESELHAVGFRRRSRWYWRAERRFELPPDAYVSLFAGAECRPTGDDRRSRPRLLEVSTFHVTFRLGIDNLHFYYHERDEGEWEPGGHTSGGEIRRYRVEPRQLRDQADAVAARVVAAFRGVLLPRSEEPQGGDEA